MNEPRIRGLSQPLAKRYGVSPKTIRDIWNRRTWTLATTSCCSLPSSYNTMCFRAPNKVSKKLVLCQRSSLIHAFQGIGAKDRQRKYGCPKGPQNKNSSVGKSDSTSSDFRLGPISSQVENVRSRVNVVEGLDAIMNSDLKTDGVFNPFPGNVLLMSNAHGTGYYSTKALLFQSEVQTLDDALFAIFENPISTPYECLHESSMLADPFHFDWPFW